VREHWTRNNAARTSRTSTKTIKNRRAILFFIQSFSWRPTVFVDFPTLSHCRRLEWITQCTCQINNVGLTVGRGLGWKSTLTTANGASPWKNVCSFKATAIQAQDLYSRELSLYSRSSCNFTGTASNLAGISSLLLPTQLETPVSFNIENSFFVDYSKPKFEAEHYETIYV